MNMFKKKLIVYYFIGVFFFTPLVSYAGTVKELLTELTQIVGTTLLIALGGLVFIGFTINIIKLMNSVDGKNQSEIKSRLVWSFGLLLGLISIFGIIGLLQDWFNFPNYFEGTGTVEDTFQIAPEVIDVSDFDGSVAPAGNSPVSTNQQTGNNTNQNTSIFSESN